MMDLFFVQLNESKGVPVSLSPREAFKVLQNGAAILDIRPEYETSFRIFDVPKVFYLPYSLYRDELSSMPKDVPLIIADSVGNQSKEVACYITSRGYAQVAYMAGGIVEWDRAGLPLRKDIDYEMVGGCACRLQPQKPRVKGSSVSPK
jgi:rhodanese-related sulfurtransferase